MDKEMANVPTKEEQITRAKRAKEKDDLVKELLHYANNELAHGIKNLVDCESCANYLIDNLGYRKIAENEVVISKEEYEHINSCYNVTRKETAEKIFKELFKRAEQQTFFDCRMALDLDNLAKEFGVEIKE